MPSQARPIPGASSASDFATTAVITHFGVWAGPLPQIMVQPVRQAGQGFFHLSRRVRGEIEPCRAPPFVPAQPEVRRLLAVLSATDGLSSSRSLGYVGLRVLVN